MAHSSTYGQRGRGSNVNPAGLLVARYFCTDDNSAELLGEVVGVDNACETRCRAIEKPVTGITAAERAAREGLRVEDGAVRAPKQDGD